MRKYEIMFIVKPDLEEMKKRNMNGNIFTQIVIKRQKKKNKGSKGI